MTKEQEDAYFDDLNSQPAESYASKPERHAGAGSVQPVGRRIHTIPIGDKELHAAQVTCWCHPTETEPRIIVHNALDCREAQERATGEKASEGWILIAEYVFPDSPTGADMLHRKDPKE